MQHNLNSFSLESEPDSFYEFEGTDFSKIAGDDGGMPAFINLPTRERKKIYNVSQSIHWAQNLLRRYQLLHNIQALIDDFLDNVLLLFLPESHPRESVSSTSTKTERSSNAWFPVLQHCSNERNH